jgi:hypothetical protein
MQLPSIQLYLGLVVRLDLNYWWIALSSLAEGKEYHKQGRRRMIRLIAVAGFALAVATSAQAMTPAPIPQPDSMIMQVRAGCGAGRVMRGGVCVARTTIRQTRRAYRRGYWEQPNWRSIHRNRTPVANAVSTPLALNVLLFVPA